MGTFEKLGSEPLVICIDGAGGGGKTTLANRIIEAAGVGQDQLIHGDWYFEPAPKGSTTPGYFNADRFMTEVGVPLSAHTTPVVREYNMKNDEMVEHDPPNPKQLIVVEGIKMLQLEVNWGFKIWVETPRDTRKERFLDRRSEDRRTDITDREVLSRNFDVWADDADNYRQKVMAEDLPDVVVKGDDTPDTQLEVIAARLEQDFFSNQ